MPHFSSSKTTTMVDEFQLVKHAMKPIIFAFRLSGIPLLYDDPGEKAKWGLGYRWIIQSALVTLMAFLVTASGIAMSIYRIMTCPDKGDVAQQLCGIVILSSVVTMHFIVLLKHKLLNHLLDQVFRMSVSVPHLRRLVIVAIILSYILSLIVCVNYINFGKDLSVVDEQPSVNQSDWAETFRIDPLLSAVMEIGTPIFTCIFILPFYFLTIGIFIIVCCTVEHNFAQMSLKIPSQTINDDFNKQYTYKTVIFDIRGTENKIFWGCFNEKISQFCRRHQAVCHLVELTDDAFGIMCFVWSTAEVIAIVLALRSMDLLNGSNRIRYQLLAVFLLSVICFVSRSIYAARVNSMVLDSLKHLRFMPEVFANAHSFNEIAIQNGINCYVLNMSVTSPSITGWGFFNVNKGLILAVGGTIVTYVLVLYQDA